MKCCVGVCLIALGVAGCDLVSDSRVGEPVTPNELDCQQLDPSRVYLQGTLIGGTSDQQALAPVDAPSQACIGIGASASAGVVLPDGGFAWQDPTTNKVFLYEPDAWGHDGQRWAYPDHWALNDGVIAQSSCQIDHERLVVDPNTGEVLYQCDGRWYRQGGEELPEQMDHDDVRAALPGGGFFLERWDYYWDAQGDAVELLLPDGQPEYGEIATRHSPDGLWIAVEFDGRFTRWLLKAGTLHFEGDYAPVDGEVESWKPPALGPDGSLYAFADVHDKLADEIFEAVVRLPLEPGQPEVVYDVRDAPKGSSWLTAGTRPGAWVDLKHAVLVTGP